MKKNWALAWDHKRTQNNCWKLWMVGHLLIIISLPWCSVWCCRDGQKEVLNTQCGHMLRTKTQGTDEGGIVVGFAVLDTPYVVDVWKRALQLFCYFSSDNPYVLIPWYFLLHKFAQSCARVQDLTFHSGELNFKLLGTCSWGFKKRFIFRVGGGGFVVKHVFFDQLWHLHWTIDNFCACSPKGRDKPWLSLWYEMRIW